MRGSGTGCASGQEQDGCLLCGGLICAEGCIGAQSSDMGRALRISAVILATGQRAAAFPSAPCGGSGKGGWQDPHSCLVPPPACLCTPTASFALPLQEGSLQLNHTVTPKPPY